MAAVNTTCRVSAHEFKASLAEEFSFRIVQTLSEMHPKEGHRFTTEAIAKFTDAALAAMTVLEDGQTESRPLSARDMRALSARAKENMPLQCFLAGLDHSPKSDLATS